VNTTLTGPGEIELFDAATGQWTAVKKNVAGLSLPPGGGKLLRVP
jgi:hypothetical protein